MLVSAQRQFVSSRSMPGWTARHIFSLEEYVRLNVVTAALVVVVTLCAGVAAARQVKTRTSNGAETQSITVEFVKEQLKQVEDSAELNEATKNELRQSYQQALQELQSAANHAAAESRYARDIETAEEELRRIESELASLPDKPDLRASENLTPRNVQERLKLKRAELNTANNDLAQWKAEPTRRAARVLEISNELAATEKEFADLEDRTTASVDPNDVSPLAVARRTLAKAQRAALNKKVAALERERAAYDVTVELPTRRHTLSEKRVALLLQEVDDLERTERGMRRGELDEQVLRAQQELDATPPELQLYAQDNFELAHQRRNLRAQIDEAQVEYGQVDDALKKQRLQVAETQEQIKLVGLSEAIGLKLRTQRATLPELGLLRRQSRERQAKIRDVQRAMFELQNRRSQLDGPRRSEIPAEPSVTQSQPDLAAPSATPPNPAPFRDDLLATQRHYLDLLLVDYQDFFYLLVDVDSKQRELIAELENYVRFIDERVLWIRSNQMLGRDDARHALDGLLWLVDPLEWRDVAHSLVADLRSSPLLYLSAILLLSLLVYHRKNINARVEQIGERAVHGAAHAYLPTLEALLLTILVSVPWPGLMWFVGRRLSAVFGSLPLANAVGAGLSETAPVYLLLVLLLQTCRAKGLASAHFGWMHADLRPLRTYLWRFTLVITPVMLIATTSYAQENLLWRYSLGRITFAVAMLIVAGFAEYLLRPWGRRGLLYQVLAVRPDSWLVRLRNLWYVLAVGSPLVLAVLAVTGYFYTAHRLAVRLETSIWLLVGLFLVGSLLLRWVLVNRRGLAIRQARELRDGSQVGVTPSMNQVESDSAPVEGVPSLDLTTINTQTRQFLLSLVGVVALVCFWLVWVDVLPALGLLDQVSVWGAITLVDLFVAVLTVAMTYVGAKNVPGLLEMIVLQRLPLDASLRYTITTVSRYAIVFVGLLVVCGVLGIEWAKVQWLVAALTVGLGFGLQEIFANFVSGLIVLIERPVRVGDLVTIGETNGTVTKIQMRATTILDWNRRELIVPNKELVTGKLVNWTLSDSTFRVDLRVGIAYGSDTELARKILLQIAAENPNVLDQPPAKAVFRGFGDSALDFELRVYIPHMDYWPRVVTEVNTEIDKRFRQAGVEIAFPQRDIHIRSIHGEWPIRVASGEDGNPTETTRLPKE